MNEGDAVEVQTPTEWRTVGEEDQQARHGELDHESGSPGHFDSVDLWTSPSASGASFPQGSPGSQNDNRESGDIVSLETSGNNPTSLLLPPNQAIALTVAQKLREAGLEEYAEKLERCHTKWTVLRCQHCGKRYRFPERCDLRFCPNCQHRLSRKRKEELEWWIRLLNRPKHVVLTVRNTAELTKQYIQWVKKCFTRLRRRKFARNWRSGVYSIEVTNEGRGWHVHIHALIQATWIDAKELARQWADIVGQDFAIVWVKQAVGTEAADEVLKYAVKGNQIACWSPEEIRQYILATEGIRLFGRFGELTGELEEWKRQTESMVDTGFKCDCGSTDFDILRDLDYLTALKLAKGPPEFWDQYVQDQLIEEVVELAMAP